MKYLTEDDLTELNCTNFSKVARKLGFEYTEDFFDELNETIFVKVDNKAHFVKMVQNHDIYADYFVGEFSHEINN